TNAKEDREKLINQSQSYRNDILPKAQGEAAQVVNQALGYAQARLNRAQGETNRFVATLKEYNQAKDIISKRIYIETMEEILPNIEKVIIDGKVGDRVLPYLPLARLIARTGTGPEEQQSRPSRGSSLVCWWSSSGCFSWEPHRSSYWTSPRMRSWSNSGSQFAISRSRGSM